MPHYLMQLAYTPEAWAGLVKSPKNRIKDVTPQVEKAGMKVVCSYVSFGEYDIIAIVEAPDNVMAAGLAMDFAAGGSLRAVKTTPLMSWEDGVKAMKAAGGKIGYTPYKPAARKTAARKPAARKTAARRKR